MANFTIQTYQNLQNVNADNMNTFYQGKDAEVVGYFPINPSICSGVGGTYNNYGQEGTSNVFNFANGILRFIDQPTDLSGATNYQIFVNYTGTSPTIAIGSGGGTQYVVAQLTLTNLDPYRVQTSGTILTTTMNLSQIGSNPLLMALFVLTPDGPNYVVTIDSNCAWNYNGNQTILNYPSITNLDIEQINIQTISPTSGINTLFSLAFDDNGIPNNAFTATNGSGSNSSSFAQFASPTNPAFLFTSLSNNVGVNTFSRLYMNCDAIGNPITAWENSVPTGILRSAILQSTPPSSNTGAITFSWSQISPAMTLTKASTYTNPIALISDLSFMSGTIGGITYEAQTLANGYTLLTYYGIPANSGDTSETISFPVSFTDYGSLVIVGNLSNIGGTSNWIVGTSTPTSGGFTISFNSALSTNDTLNIFVIGQ